MDYNYKRKKSVGRRGSGLEYRKYRVRGHIKSFRDLEIYRKTTQLSSEIFKLKFTSKTVSKSIISKEFEILRDLSKRPPKLVAESYGIKFVDKDKAYGLLEEAARIISLIISKIDFLMSLDESAESRAELSKFVSKYEVQKRKILNLKRAWIRIDEKFKEIQQRKQKR